MCVCMRVYADKAGAVGKLGMAVRHNYTIKGALQLLSKRHK